MKFLESLNIARRFARSLTFFHAAFKWIIEIDQVIIGAGRRALRTNSSDKYFNSQFPGFLELVVGYDYKSTTVNSVLSVMEPGGSGSINILANSGLAIAALNAPSMVARSG